MLVNRVNGTALTPLHALTRDFDRMFESLLDRPANHPTGVPPVSIWEDERGFHLEAQVPGVQAEDLDVSVTGNRVTLKGERKQRTRENATVHREEWSAYRFERTFELPTDVDGANLSATLEHGVLLVDLPKAAQHKPVKVQIRQADKS